MSFRVSDKTSKAAVATAGIGAVAAFVVGLALPAVKESEGLRTSAYLDPVGVPTICFGETLGVKIGDVKSPAQCDAMLVKRLHSFLEEMRACTTRQLPAKTEAALLSFAYNLGTGTYCQNLASKRINPGKLWETCQALSLYTKAGGRELPGLVKRRAEERALCEEGLREAGLH